jgi:hypothetical protein
LEDLKARANLTHQQKVGVRLYEDLLDRMPREEAAEIEHVVSACTGLFQVCVSLSVTQADSKSVLELTLCLLLMLAIKFLRFFYALSLITFTNKINTTCS